MALSTDEMRLEVLKLALEAEPNPCNTERVMLRARIYAAFIEGQCLEPSEDSGDKV